MCGKPWSCHAETHQREGSSLSNHALDQKNSSASGDSNRSSWVEVRARVTTGVRATLRDKKVRVGARARVIDRGSSSTKIVCECPG